MTIANWKTQVYGVVQSLLLNNPHRVAGMMVRAADGQLRRGRSLRAIGA